MFTPQSINLYTANQMQSTKDHSGKRTQGHFLPPIPFFYPYFLLLFLSYPSRQPLVIPNTLIQTETLGEESLLGKSFIPLVPIGLRDSPGTSQGFKYRLVAGDRYGDTKVILSISYDLLLAAGGKGPGVKACLSLSHRSFYLKLEILLYE